MTLHIVKTIEEVREAVAKAKATGQSTCLVPTMGGLHAGHMSLVEKANTFADFVIVSIFVNPTQFNNPDDLENYPSNEKDDLNKLRKTDTDIVFTPSAREMYPDGFSTRVDVAASSDILCDAHRPGHFDGVATIVAKLFLQTGAEYACFGEKDYQQLFIIKRLVRDLDIPITIIPVETVREEDGLALSSRNARLTKSHRKIASKLNEAMRSAALQITNGAKAEMACKNAVDELEASHPFKVEYLEARSGESLEPVGEFEPGCRIFSAAWLGDVRLIDNIAVEV